MRRPLTEAGRARSRREPEEPDERRDEDEQLTIPFERTRRDDYFPDGCNTNEK
jgi:hypothetical protein